MEPNFKILIHSNSDNLHLKLIGIFDITAANELLNTIKNHKPVMHKIFIHTNCLDEIDPSAKSFLHKNLPGIGNANQMYIFTGDGWNSLAK